MLPLLSNDQNYRLTGGSESTGSNPEQHLLKDKSEKKRKKEKSLKKTDYSSLCAVLPEVKQSSLSLCKHLR